MQAIGIPRQTVDWLVSSAPYIEALVEDLSAGPPANGYCSAGSLRFRTDKGLTVLWHRDYAASGIEVEWMIVRIDGKMGLLSVEENLSRLALARVVRVAHLRLRNLNLPMSFMAHSFEGNRYTCFAGRGGGAWKHSIGWLDERSASGTHNTRYLGFVGPWQDPGDDARNQQAALVGGLEQDHGEFRALAARCRTLREGPLTGGSLGDGWARTREIEIAVDRGQNAEDSADAVTARMSSPLAPTEDLTFRECMAPDGPLTRTQRIALEHRRIGEMPVRIHGPAGSGKSLLMQLLAIRRAEAAVRNDEQSSVLYLAHNTSAKDHVDRRLLSLADDVDLKEAVGSVVQVATINDLAQRYLSNFEKSNLLDPDNSDSKDYQVEFVRDLLCEKVSGLRDTDSLADCPTIAAVAADDSLLDQLARAVVSDIGYVIKAQLRDKGREAYVLSEKPLSRLHNILTEKERDLIYDVFMAYDGDVSAQQGRLDNDDVALSLLQTLSTPLWRNVRREKGCDLLLVDEAQLYSPTEKLLFQYLCRRETPPHPIVLALDKGQDLEGRNEQGLGLLGVGAVDNIEVYEMQRCSADITSVAMDVIYQSIDLFDEDFQPFPKDLGATATKKNIKPAIRWAKSNRVSKAAIRAARELRKKNLRSIGIVAVSQAMFRDLVDEAKEPDMLVLQDRSASLPSRPHIAIGSPSAVGGLEFDGVIVVGCERGIFPPIVPSNGFQGVLDQQCLRELYLAVTRAKHALLFLLSPGASPSSLLQPSMNLGNIAVEESA